MKIYTEVNWQWNDEQDKLVEVSSESEEYEGDIQLAQESDEPEGGYGYDPADLFDRDTSQATAPTYNYWISQLPPDLQSELMGIFSDPGNIEGAGHHTSQLISPGVSSFQHDYGASGTYNPFHGVEGMDWYNPYSNIGAAGAYDEGFAQSQLGAFQSGSGYTGSTEHGAGQEAAQAWYDWYRSPEGVAAAEGDEFDASSNPYHLYNYLMGDRGGIGAGPIESKVSFNFAPYVDLMSGSAIGRGLSEAKDLSTALPPQTSLTEELIKQQRGSYYRPYLEASREELAGDLYSGLQGTAGQRGTETLGKGLQGYGGRRRASQDVWDKFYAGMSKSMSDIEARRGQARSRIGDIFSQWREALSSA